MPQVQIVHLATHGLLDDFKGLGVPGAIALAPSSTDNGLLTASEILDLPMRAELVILSACDTGRGSITGMALSDCPAPSLPQGCPALLSLFGVFLMPPQLL